MLISYFLFLLLCGIITLCYNKRERSRVMEVIEFKEENEFIDKVKKINQDKKLRYNILTMGCMLNENDSEKLKRND